MISRRVADLLRQNGVERLGYLPCEKLKGLIANLSPRTAVWHLTRESAGVALAFGWAMGGRRAALLMQSTGVGNLITELLTLPVLYQLPLPVLVSWRGHYKEPIEAQRLLGERLVPMLQALRVPVSVIETADDLPALGQGLARCYASSAVEFFLLSPRLWEDDGPAAQPVVGHPRLARVAVEEPAFDASAGLTRFEAIRAVLHGLDEKAAVVAQIGYPAREAYAARDRDRNLYLLGALGSATLVGIGLAQARPDLEVIVLDGDGAFLLNPNQMLELGQSCPPNLRVVLLDNGSWGSTGSQPTLTSCGLNLAAFGAALGTPRWERVTDEAGWRQARARGARLVHFLIRAGNADVGTIPLSASAIAQRFRLALSGHRLDAASAPVPGPFGARNWDPSGASAGPSPVLPDRIP